MQVSDFTLEEGQECALQGSSGSGKSTFLNLVAGLLPPDRGKVVLDGQDLARLGEAARDSYRARKIGYIFQSFHLLPALSALENVLLGMYIGGHCDVERATQLLERVGLGDRLQHRPAQLSVGQRQRVAVARAVANRPRLVLADEPTGNLDRATSITVMELIREICRESGAALLLASHDGDVLAGFARVVRL